MNPRSSLTKVPSFAREREPLEGGSLALLGASALKQSGRKSRGQSSRVTVVWLPRGFPFAEEHHVAPSDPASVRSCGFGERYKSSLTLQQAGLELRMPLGQRIVEMAPKRRRRICDLRGELLLGTRLTSQGGSGEDQVADLLNLAGRLERAINPRALARKGLVAQSGFRAISYSPSEPTTSSPFERWWPASMRK